MKTEVYSWRLSTSLKMELEHEARRRKTTVSKVLDQAAREWLDQNGADDDEEQRRLHAAVARTFGTISGGDPYRSENVRETVRARLRKKYGR